MSKIPPASNREHCRTPRRLLRRRQSQPGSPDRRAGMVRRAIATVETAILLPVLFTLIFGTLEISVRVMLRQSATVAAYETARSAARRGVTTAAAEARGQSILAGRGIERAWVRFSPADISVLRPGEQFRVTVGIPVRHNTPINYVVPATGSIRVNAFMLRE